MSAGSLTIRDAGPEDAGAVSRLLARAYGEFEASFPWPDYWDVYIGEVTGVRARLGRSRIVVAELDGDVVGSADYYAPGNDAYDEMVAWPPDWASFRYLATDPDRRGNGIGTALLDHLVTLAAGDRATHLALHSLPMFTTAMRLYEAKGFEREPEHDLVPVPEQPDQVLAFVLRLDGRGAGRER